MSAILTARPSAHKLKLKLATAQRQPEKLVFVNFSPVLSVNWPQEQRSIVEEYILFGPEDAERHIIDLPPFDSTMPEQPLTVVRVGEIVQHAEKRLVAKLKAIKATKQNVVADLVDTPLPIAIKYLRSKAWPSYYPVFEDGKFQQLLRLAT